MIPYSHLFSKFLVIYILLGALCTSRLSDNYFSVPINTAALIISSRLNKWFTFNVRPTDARGMFHHHHHIVFHSRLQLELKCCTQFFYLALVKLEEFECCFQSDVWKMFFMSPYVQLFVGHSLLLISCLVWFLVFSYLKSFWSYLVVFFFTTVPLHTTLMLIC